ncbi:nuclear transport factor 2 family protein [Rhodococcoides fascians]|uniref:nuclear transport factor 2 family protein n=1 Tax=Rhodococcoides fascians TaxID=1828 RepID=UPI00050C1A41|nr:nuclear transport factor 2 family protein [Rhodococcus fascians]
MQGEAEPNRWSDSQEVLAVVNEYFRSLDDRELDAEHLRRIFGDDGRIVRPDDTTTIGPEEIGRTHTHNFSRFEATQHLVTGHTITIDEYRAQFRANLVAIHIWKDRPKGKLDDRAFTAGGVVTAALDRTSNGWRISTLHLRVVWRTGHFGDMRPSH